MAWLDGAVGRYDSLPERGGYVRRCTLDRNERGEDRNERGEDRNERGEDRNERGENSGDIGWWYRSLNRQYVVPINFLALGL